MLKLRFLGRQHVLASLALLVTGAVSVAACVGNDAGTTGDVPPGTDGGTDSAIGTGGDSGGGGGDASSEAAATGCACADTGAALSCAGVKTACEYGCAEPTADVAAHCRRFDPTGVVEPDDLIVAGLKDYTGKNLKFFTETGQITTADGATEIRAANANPNKQEVDAAGIGFRRVDGKLGIFQFKNLTINPADSFNWNGAVGNVALALVAAEQITINGKLDLGCSFGQLYAYVPAGSSPGGYSAVTTASADGSGPGKGKGGTVVGDVVGGGGGGGHGQSGGGGGQGLNVSTGNGGAGGAAYTDPGFDPPLGGSGGGSGRQAGGGPGGGAVQIVAGKKITIGTGAGAANPLNLQQGINVGGCGGSGGIVGASGGGGSGGTIILEAPEIVGNANAGVASNGGGGGGGISDGTSVSSGTISLTAAAGQGGNACYGAGGAGGAGSATYGSTGFTGASACGGTAEKYGGGGGGSTGFIRILTGTGTFTPNATFVVSPSLAPQLQQGKIATR